MKKHSLLLLNFLLLASGASALECPPNNAPLCPDSGSTLLDETYPTQAFIMSNGPSFKSKPPPSKEHLAVTRNYINTIIKSYDYKNVPQIMLAVYNESEFNSYKTMIKADLEKKKLKADEIEKIVSQLTHMPSPNYTWQQDYFESFVNLETGRPEVRHIDSYSRMSKSVTGKMAEVGQACRVTQGESIATDYKSFGSGEMGGNIEGAPGGFCLVGNNMGPEFSKSFCGKEENVINLNTSFLSVGHVDEIFKIIPNHANDGRPNECKFSLMAASTSKALSLLKDPRFAKRPYFDFPAGTSADDLDDLKDSRSNVENLTNYKLCNYMNEAAKTKPKSKKDARSQQGKTVFMDWLIDSATAEGEDPFKTACKSNVTTVTNAEMHQQFINDSENLKLNVAIQESIDKDTALIKDKILSRLPQCAKYFDVIDVPNYFEGGPLINDPVTGKAQLSLHGNVNAFLPNPTNSVLMNKTLLFPDAGNSAYNDFLTEEMKKRKMKADFISTWDYAHLGMGNIHCSSHSLPYCQPRSK